MVGFYTLCICLRGKGFMRAVERNRFKKILLEKKAQLEGKVYKMEDDVLKNKEHGVSVDHMADAGTDSFEQEFNLGLIANEEELLREINDALLRIEDESFGDCEACPQPVAPERLKAIPWARYCLDCQEKVEKGSLEW